MFKRIYRALAVAMAWSLVITSVAFADNAVTDGDVAVAGSQDLAMGNVCRDDTTSADASLTISRNGSYGSPNVFKKGSTVTWSVLTASSGLTATFPSGATGAIPSDWNEADNNTLSPAVTTRVHYAAPDSTGPFSGSITFRATGIRDDGTTLTRDDMLSVSATRVTCVTPDTTAPTSASISINSNATWTNSASVSLALAAQDNVGITKYRLAESQSDLASATDVAVTPTTNFSASSVGFTLSGLDGSSKAVWVRFFDAAGNYTDGNDTIGLDRVAPTIQDDGVSAGTLGDNGWYKSAVSNDFSASDAGSGLDAACAAAFPKTVSTGASEGTNVTVASGACSDLAGNTNSGISSAGFDIDLVAPVIIRNTSADSCDDPGTNGWCKGTQTAGFTASDATSGVAPTGAASINFTQSSSTEGANVSISSGTRSDMAGHVATAINAGPFKVDSTDPGMTCGATPTFMLGQANASVSATVTDTTSGPLQATVSGAANTSLAAGGTVSLTGYDNAGNSTTVECPFSIASVTFGNPINAPSVMNVAKLGRVIPIKATVLVNNVAMTDGPVYLGGLGNASCTTGVTSDSVEEYAAAGSSNTGNLFRWDSIESRWMYNYDTSALKGGSCYRINVHIGGTVDGSGKASGGALAGYFLIKVTK